MVTYEAEFYYKDSLQPSIEAFEASCDTEAMNIVQGLVRKTNDASRRVKGALITHTTLSGKNRR